MRIAILWRIIGLVALCAGLAILIVLLVSFEGPPPSPPPHRMEEIARFLEDGQSPVQPGLPLFRKIQEAPPTPPANFVEHQDGAAVLARMLRVSPDSVKFYIPREVDFLGLRSLLRSVGRTSGPGEPVDSERPRAPRIRLADGFLAAQETEEGWTIVDTAVSTQINNWYLFVLKSVGLTFCGVLVIAFFVARRISRPMALLADLAKRKAPSLSDEYEKVGGPPEVQLVAAALQQFQAALEASLRDRTMMLGAIAHDLRTPLTRIAFRIEKLPDADRASAMQDIQEMREMITAALSFMKDEAVVTSQSRLDLGALAGSLADDLAATGNAVAVAEVSRTIIRGDSAALRRAISNLIENALRYGGSATLSVTTDGANAFLQVADAGPGIPAHLLSRVFEPFFRIDEARGRQTGGIGLGLAIVRSIVTAHGGTVNLANAPEGGLRATLTFALCAT